MLGSERGVEIRSELSGKQQQVYFIMLTVDHHLKEIISNLKY